MGEPAYWAANGWLADAGRLDNRDAVGNRGLAVPVLEIFFVPEEAGDRWWQGLLTHAQLILAGAGPAVFINWIEGKAAFPALLQWFRRHPSVRLAYGRTALPGLIPLYSKLGGVAGPWKDAEGGVRYRFDSAGIANFWARLEAIEARRARLHPGRNAQNLAAAAGVTTSR